MPSLRMNFTLFEKICLAVIALVAPCSLAVSFAVLESYGWFATPSVRAADNRTQPKDPFASDLPARVIEPLPLVPAPVPAPEGVAGWNTLTWGMTEREVMGHIKILHLFEEPVLDGSSYAPFVLKNVRIGSFAYRVYFLFGQKTHRLRQVSIRPQDEGDEDLDNGLMFSELEMHLTRKYGKPNTKRTEVDGGARIWTSPPTVIELVRQQRGTCSVNGRQTLSSVSVSYRQSSIQNAAADDGLANL